MRKVKEARRLRFDLGSGQRQIVRVVAEWGSAQFTSIWNGVGSARSSEVSPPTLRRSGPKRGITSTKR